MNVVGFVVELQKLAVPLLGQIAEDGVEAAKDRSVDTAATIFL